MSEKLKKIGAKVAGRRRNGTIATGKLVEIVATQRGDWYHIDVTPKGAKKGDPREILKVRAANLLAPTAA